MRALLTTLVLVALSGPAPAQTTCPPGMRCAQTPDSADALRRRNQQIDNQRQQMDQLRNNALQDQIWQRQQLQDQIRRRTIIVPGIDAGPNLQPPG
ncbi:hypothetical protein CG51_16755 [Haematobacter missouriensis]|uniref:Uncharacterized protein n=1 Tax=Haematobacter missouriensis TaxID=366616 RepID=A0A212AYB9_9RHOB|nr:hypothetical protein CG51_16755 [Haematobacter missouriensis]OWJ78663.1 hypothetical protein CDV53_03135 [Haematobacter missouriensis]OWJ86458.1 hypothetical protein CDV52_00400 [Haematobacter missouriensis]